jgi:hypothetical protein
MDNFTLIRMILLEVPWQLKYLTWLLMQSTLDSYPQVFRSLFAAFFAPVNAPKIPF